MLEREILIANSRTQQRNKLTTAATTLGELKADMEAAGIDYSGLSFTEGITKTELLSDDTQLPHDVMFKGNVTNNLVILLTNTKKNIASGMGTRAAAYEFIYENDLQDEIKNHFCRNFTQVATADLWQYFYDGGYLETDDAEEEVQQEAPHAKSLLSPICELIEDLAETGAVSAEEIVAFVETIDKWAERLKNKTISMNVGNTKVTSKDVDDMIASL